MALSGVFVLSLRSNVKMNFKIKKFIISRIIKILTKAHKDKKNNVVLYNSHVLIAKGKYDHLQTFIGNMSFGNGR